MHEGKAGGMQELALETQLARPPVDGVARNREVDRGEMDADLVCPAGLELDVEECMAREQLEQLELRHRIARGRSVERTPERIAAVAADRRFDTSTARARPAHDERQVAPLERTVADESLKAPMRLFRTRDDHQAGGLAIEPMHDPGAFGLAAGDVVGKKTVTERPGWVTGRRMNDEPGRLVHDDEVLVLVRDSQPHRFRGEFRRRAIRRREFDLLAPGQPMTLFLPQAVDENTSCLEQPLGNA